MLDTEGRELPKDVASYWAQGPIDDARFAALEPLLWRKHIEMIMIDTGDDEAGSIEVVAPQRRSELTTWPPTARTHGAPCTRTCSSYSALRDPPIPTQVSGWENFFNFFLPNNGGPAPLSGISLYDCAVRQHKKERKRWTKRK